MNEGLTTRPGNSPRGGKVVSLDTERQKRADRKDFAHHGSEVFRTARTAIEYIRRETNRPRALEAIGELGAILRDVIQALRVRFPTCELDEHENHAQHAIDYSREYLSKIEKKQNVRDLEEKYPDVRDSLTMIATKIYNTFQEESRR